MSHYISYYDFQVGGERGRACFCRYSTSARKRYWEFKARLLRKALPLLKSGAHPVGKEAFRAGMNVLDDVGSRDVSFKEAL